MLEYSAFNYTDSIIGQKYFFQSTYSHKDFKILAILLKVGTVIA